MPDSPLNWPIVVTRGAVLCLYQIELLLSARDVEESLIPPKALDLDVHRILPASAILRPVRHPTYKPFCAYLESQANKLVYRYSILGLALKYLLNVADCSGGMSFIVKARRFAVLTPLCILEAFFLDGFPRIAGWDDR